MNESHVLVGLATYNERANLPSLVAAIHAQLPAARVLVVDDNSPDGTGDWCEEFARHQSWFAVVKREGKLGLGTALLLLMQMAVAHKATHLVTLDADWSHPPERLRDLLAAADQVDVVIGSRYCAGGEIVGWPWSRRVLSRVLNFFSRAVLGLSISDCSGNYRVYSTRILSRLPASQPNSTGYAFIEEVLWYLKVVGATFVEVPIRFTDRVAGESKISMRESFGAVRMLLSLARRRTGK